MPEPSEIVGVWFGEDTYVWLVYQPNTEDYYDACTTGTYTAADGILSTHTTGLIADVDPITGEIIWMAFETEGTAGFEITGDTLTLEIDMSGWNGSPNTIWTLIREQ
jgi:hypothetical protein